MGFFMATKIAIASISASISASNAAIAAAHRARVSECNVIIDSYDSHDADIHAMQEYADCVDTIHPKNFAVGDTFILKALFVSAIFCAIFIIWRESRKFYSDITVGILGFIATSLAIFFALLFLKCI
jgi:hypothetical protein